MSVPSRSRGIRHVRAKRSAVSRQVLLPAQSIIHNEVVSGVTLLLAAVAALVWANSPWSEGYHEFQALPLAFKLGDFVIAEDLHHWINDGLMAIFFFAMGLEIKREAVSGELAEWRRAAFPVAAAVGGMVVPAAIYVAFNVGGDGLRGWGIPMATDIAFALGVLALLGEGIPSQLRIFLLALAIVDDIGAILVIALFYTEQLSIPALALGGGFLGCILLMLKFGSRNPFLYLIAGLLFWGAVFESGVHATIAGVILGIITPCRRWFSERRFTELASAQLDGLTQALNQRHDEEVHAALGRMEELTRETESPLDRLERLVHPWVSFLVLPLFALINAGVTFSAEMVQGALGSPVTEGVFGGLVVGKALGIVGVAWIAVRQQFARMPDELGWRDIAGVAVLAGIGFTVALFITELAFQNGEAVQHAKVGILAASALAGIAGYTTLRFFRGEKG
jgi:Na+:H+ antiporter, NhaA family